MIEIAVDCILAHKPNATIILNSDSKSYLDQTDRDVIKYYRSSNLGHDNTLMCDVLNEMDGKCPEYTNNSIVSIVQATCPFRLPVHFHMAENEFCIGKHKSLTSVTKVSDMHPARMYLSKGRHLEALNKEYESNNRQNLPEVFHRNGLIYITNKAILHSRRILGPNPGYIEIPRKYCINIDDEYDWEIANAIFNA